MECCNINFQLTKNAPVIIHNLRGYDSHLIFSELNKFDVKINVIANGLEKYMAFFSSTKKGKIGNNDEISDDHLSVKDYMTCEKIWNKFDMKNMGDYHDHYLKKDVFLLADVFEKFIGMFLKFYELDPCYYFSSPRLSWDAMQKMNIVKLEKISDIDMYSFIKKGLRGGISYIAKIHAKADIKYTEDYDPKKLSNVIVYLDINNLYGWAKSEYLPYGGLEWLKNVDEFDVMLISEKK